MLAEPKARTSVLPSRAFRTETVIFVTSFIRARRFYNRVFQCQPEHSDALCGTAQYSLPERIVTLKTAWSQTADVFDTELRILVDDFLYEYQRLQLLGVEQVGAVTENCHGETSMKIADEDGNILTIVARNTAKTTRFLEPP
jgi:hypothetical protein